MRMASDSERRYHNLLYIPFGSDSAHSLSPIEYLIYPIGLKKVFRHSSRLSTLRLLLRLRDKFDDWKMNINDSFRFTKKLSFD